MMFSFDVEGVAYYLRYASGSLVLIEVDLTC